MTTLDPVEARGRWKSFLGKWNRGELASGWYEPEVFARVAEKWVASMKGTGPGPGMGSGDGTENGRGGTGEPEKGGEGKREGGEKEKESEDEDEDDDFGPALPGMTSSSRTRRRKGPGIPTLEDLTVQREALAEDREAARADLRAERKADRRQQKERLEELVPRADAGTRERRLEKRKEVNEKMRSFRDRSPGGDEVADEDLVGGADGGVAEYKRALAVERQKMTERQLRREEISRARAAEREERVSAYREREERAVEKLRELARARFG